MLALGTGRVHRYYRNHESEKDGEEMMTKEQELIISLLQQLNKTFAEVVKLQQFVISELRKPVEK